MRRQLKHLFPRIFYKRSSSKSTYKVANPLFSDNTPRLTEQIAASTRMRANVSPDTRSSTVVTRRQPKIGFVRYCPEQSEQDSVKQQLRMQNYKPFHFARQINKNILIRIPPQNSEPTTNLNNLNEPQRTSDPHSQQFDYSNNNDNNYNRNETLQHNFHNSEQTINNHSQHFSSIPAQQGLTPYQQDIINTFYQKYPPESPPISSPCKTNKQKLRRSNTTNKKCIRRINPTKLPTLNQNSQRTTNRRKSRHIPSQSQSQSYQSSQKQYSQCSLAQQQQFQQLISIICTHGYGIKYLTYAECKKNRKLTQEDYDQLLNMLLRWAFRKLQTQISSSSRTRIKPFTEFELAKLSKILLRAPQQSSLFSQLLNCLSKHTDIESTDCKQLFSQLQKMIRKRTSNIRVNQNYRSHWTTDMQSSLLTSYLQHQTLASLTKQFIAKYQDAQFTISKIKNRISQVLHKAITKFLEQYPQYNNGNAYPIILDQQHICTILKAKDTLSARKKLIELYLNQSPNYTQVFENGMAIAGALAGKQSRFEEFVNIIEDRFKQYRKELMENAEANLAEDEQSL